MSFQYISVKKEPDWAVGVNKNHQNDDQNVEGSDNASKKKVKKELQENSSNVDMEQKNAESSSNEPTEAEVVPGEPVRVSTPGYHRRERTTNFSSEDNRIFRGIIDKYSEILFNKKTDTVTNLKKKATWVKIEAEFNALASNKRTVRQLQAKLDNIKRNRRKRANDLQASVYTPPADSPATDAEQRSENDNTVSMDGIGNSVDENSFNVWLYFPFIQFHMLLGLVRRVRSSPNSILRMIADRVDCPYMLHCEGLHSPEVQITERQTASEEPHSTAMADLQSDSSEVHLCPGTPPAPRVRPRAAKPRVRKRENNTDESIIKLRRLKIEAAQSAREYDRMLFLTKLQHLEEKRKEEKEIYELKKRKLELEISLMEKK